MPFQWAIFREQFELAEWLLSLGADPNGVNRQGMNAFFFSTSVETCEFLKRKGCRLDYRDEDGATMLHS